LTDGHAAGTLTDRGAHLSVSVVIATRNGGATIADQLEALAAQDYAGPVQVVVADNGSTDDVVERARAFSERIPGLAVVDASGGRGISYARNAGARAARGEILLFCDDDDVVAPDWVRLMVDALRDVDLVGGTVELETLNRPLGIEPEVPRILEVFGDRGSPPFPMGANVGLRRTVFEAIGGYDEHFAGGGDDADFSWRVELAGYRVGFAAGAVVHRRLRPRLRSVARQFYAYGRMTALLRRKYAGHFPPRPLRHAAKDWAVTAGGIVNVVRSRRDRRRWVGHSAMLVGRLVGCVRYRVMAP